MLHHAVGARRVTQRDHGRRLYAELGTAGRRVLVNRRTARADVARETTWVVDEYREALQRLGTL